jgi:transcriptional regulator with XRE-family HTH domain
MPTATATHQALLAARLEAVMRRQGLSVRQLALRAGLPLSVVQKLIAGEGRQTSVWTLAQLADTLAVSLDYLVGRTNSDKVRVPSGRAEEDAPPPDETPATPAATPPPRGKARRPRPAAPVA